MIVPDINLLIHAYNRDSLRHAEAERWWTDLLNGSNPVGLSWLVMLGFIRLTTHRQVMARPFPVGVACGQVREWMARPMVMVIEPGPRHAELLFGLLEGLGTGGNLASDAHLAALAMEHQAELHSSDADFSRFPGLRWHNPLKPSSRR